jgi:tetratricopeptide (TPR) repeat protein
MVDSDIGVLQTKLREGIAAIRAGDRARGRDLLLEVVAADERVEPAWLWLAAAVDDPADALTALENALALNPHNTPARERRDALRAQLGLAEPLPAPPKHPAPPPVPPPTPIASQDFAAQFAVDPDDDPLQCPYCGKPTAESETRCPHCRRSLLMAGRWEGGGYLYFLLILLGLNVQGALVQVALFWGVTLLRGPWVEHSLQWTQLGDGLTSAPWLALASRSVLLFIVLALFLNDSRFAFPVAALVLALDVGVNSAAWALGIIPLPIAGFNVALSGLVSLISLAALFSQAISRERRYTQLDRNLFDANGYYQRGREYVRAGLLALAALHFQKAVTLQPRAAQFYKALGLTQARLGRFAKAQQTLEAGQSLAPDDGDFARILEAIRDRKK